MTASAVEPGAVVDEVEHIHRLGCRGGLCVPTCPRRERPTGSDGRCACDTCLYGCPCDTCRTPPAEQASTVNRRFDEALAGLGDWHGPLPSFGMADRNPEWRGQWMSQDGTRERWAHQAGVARLSLHRALADRAPQRVHYSQRLVDTYTAAALAATASVWLVVSGRHQPWDDPEYRDEDGNAFDADGDPIELLAGPFPTEDDAADHCVAHDLDDDTTSIVARLPWSAEV